jgi:hypothetical protein
VLERHDRIALQVPDVAEVCLATRIPPKHPSDVREPQAPPRRVRIAVIVVHELVVTAVAGSPHEHAVLQRHRAEKHENQAE